jgi:tetratricopeptide (TPR) repeat protein
MTRPFQEPESDRKAHWSVPVVTAIIALGAFGAWYQFVYAPTMSGRNKQPVAAGSVPLVRSGGIGVPAASADEDELRRAVLQAKAGRFADAKPALLGLLAKNPRHDEALRWLGDCHYALTEFEPAFKAYERALSANPSNQPALRGKGLALLYLGYDRWALHEAARAKKDARASQANVAEAYGRFKSALEVLRQYVRISPEDDEAAYGLAMAAEGASRELYASAVVLKRKRQAAEAKAAGENGLELVDEGVKSAKVRIEKRPDENPPGPRRLVGCLYLRRACLLRELGETGEALTDLDQAIAAHKAILAEVDNANALAQNDLKECEERKARWAVESTGGDVEMPPGTPDLEEPYRFEPPE